MSVESYRLPDEAKSFSLPNDELLTVVDLDLSALADHDVVGFNSRDIRSRPFNLLRNQVLREMRERGWNLLGVTSATPEAGKSFLATNLAAALAQLPDIRVLLFDFDLRRASLAEKLGINGDHGLTQFLDGSVDDLQSVGRRIANLNLTLYPCYSARVNSAELLAGERFSMLVEAMRELPDDVIVVCDLPPAFANDDAMAIIQKLDAYLFVIEEGVTTKSQLQEAMSLLSPAPCIGTVLNRFSVSPIDAYGYAGKYDRYYGD